MSFKKSHRYFFLLISLFFFIYTYYRSEIYHVGIYRTNYIFYYFFCFILIFFFFIQFYLSKKIYVYFTITIISIIISLYLTEIYLTFFNFQKKKITDFDTRTAFQIYLEKKHQNFVLSLGPSYFLSKKKILLPLSGMSNSDTIFCNESGNYSTYKSDRFGFNNPDDEWDKKFIDYLIIGDSFAHGACVDRPLDIASVLRSKTNAINLGFGGNGPLSEYATLREYLKPNVKNILWFYYENDLDDLKKEMKNDILMNYLNDLNFSQNLTSRHKLINNIIKEELIDIEARKNFLTNFKKNKLIVDAIINFIKIYETRRLIFLTIKIIKNTIKPTEDFEKILILANKLSIENNSKLYFVYLPSYSRYVTHFRQANIDNFKTIMEKNGIEFIDIDKEVFKKEIDPLNLFPFRSQNHYNAEGYNKIANAIYKLTR